MSELFYRARLTEEEVRDVVIGGRPAAEIAFWLAEDLLWLMKSSRLEASGLHDQVVHAVDRAERAEKALVWLWEKVDHLDSGIPFEVWDAVRAARSESS